MDIKGLSVVLDRPIQPALGVESHGKIVVCQHVSGIETEGALEGVDRLVHSAHGVQVLAEAVVDGTGIGPQRQRGAEIAKALVPPPEPVECPRQFEGHPEILREAFLRGGEQSEGRPTTLAKPGSEHSPTGVTPRRPSAPRRSAVAGPRPARGRAGEGGPGPRPGRRRGRPPGAIPAAGGPGSCSPSRRGQRRFPRATTRPARPPRQPRFCLRLDPTLPPRTPTNTGARPRPGRRSLRVRERHRPAPRVVQALCQNHVSLGLVHLPEEVVRPRPFHPPPQPLQHLPGFVEVESLAETHGLSQNRADHIAQLGPLLHEPHPAAARQSDQDQHRDQQRGRRRVAPAPAPGTLSPAQGPGPDRPALHRTVSDHRPVPRRWRSAVAAPWTSTSGRSSRCRAALSCSIARGRPARHG